MKILFIGDVVDSVGCDFVRANLVGVKRFYGIDAVIANGENTAAGNGILPKTAEHLMASGVDVITGGNHSFKRKEIYEYFDKNKPVIRPANFSENVPGNGVYILDFGKTQIAVINLIGRVYLDNYDCPFSKADELIEKLETNLIFVDFHAEATGEKGALARYLDGKVSAIAGSHTHVQTSDEQILPGGTGFITDAGMTGAVDSILGVKPEIIIKKMRTHMPARYETGTGACKMEGVVFELCEQSGKCKNTERIRVI